MKPFPLPSRLLALAFAVVPAVLAGATDQPVDRAAMLLATHGRVEVSAVGAHVEPGTYRIQVLTKLGRPDRRLPDGTWLYHRRSIQDSEASGTLLVRFDAGRVAELALVTPAIAAALQAAPPSQGGPAFYAKR